MFQVSDVDIRLLRVFVTVVEFGGFAAAQAELNISQSTLSNHMTALEQRLGFRLCHRGRGGFRLTQKGEAIYRETRQLFTALNNFSAEAGKMRGRLTGELNIGAVDAVVTNDHAPLQSVIRHFNEHDNDVHINLWIQPRQELERAVLDGRLHAAIGPFSPRLKGVAHMPLFHETQAVYCAPGHPLYERRSEDISEEEIAQSAFVARGYMKNFDSERLGGVRHDATVLNMEAQLILILSGCYLGYLPVPYAESHRLAGASLRAVRPDMLAYESGFALIVRRGRHLSNVLERFVESVNAVFNRRISNWNAPVSPVE